MFRKSICCITFIIASKVACAQTLYVSDEFEIMLRSGPTIQNKILETLKSGVQLEVLQAEVGNGYSEVQTSSGKTGFVLTRYLSPNPSARNRVAYLENQLNLLRSKPAELSSLLAKSQEDNKELISQNADISEQLSAVSKDLERIKSVSADAVNIASQNERLEGEVQELLLQLDELRISNEDLMDQSSRTQMMIGGGLVFLGLLLGWILSISGKKNRNSWGA